MTTDAILLTFVLAALLFAFGRLCRRIRRRHPGSLADRIRAAIAGEDVP